MRELTRNEMAIVKRTAKNTKQLRDKRDRIIAKQQELEAQLVGINNQIELFEQPIKQLTGGYTSEEVLNGTMEVLEESCQSGTESENTWNPEDTGECGTNCNVVPFVDNIND